MKKKSQLPQKSLDILVGNLQKSQKQWQDIYENGTHDPFYEDGMNLELVRNHIIFYRGKIRQLCEESGLPLPKEYYDELPPEVPRKFMARQEEIRKNGANALAELNSNEDYQYLQEIRGKLDEKTRNDFHVESVCCYVPALMRALEDDDLVEVRRYEYYNVFLDRIKDCANKIRSADIHFIEPEPAVEPIAEECVQMTMFEL